MDLYYHFVVNQGINLSLSGNHNAAIDSIEKAMPNLYEEDQVVSAFYLGKSYHAIGQKEKALYHFRNIDTVFSKTSNLSLPLRKSYEYLIKNAKKKKDKELQLHYTNQLLKLDSLLTKNYKKISQTITKDYDIPRLLEEKELLIVELTKDSKKTNQKLTVSIILGILITLIGLLYYYHLKLVYKKRYETIIATHELAMISRKENTAKVEEIEEVEESTIGLATTSIKAILERLQVFEDEQLYLTNQISLHDVAKIVKTNYKYLSKIINSHKNKTFTSYINDLRVDYTIDRIRNDEMYKKYTIKAIAQEAGFTNSGAFLRAFQKKTGLKPSYFIKKVRE